MRSRFVLKALCVAWVMAAACDEPTTPTFASLRFSRQPAGGIAGTPLSVSVEFLDQNGNRAKAVNDDVVITLGDAAATARTVRADEGVASIDDFVVTAASTTHVLVAKARGLEAVSLPFTVTAADPDAAHATVEVASNLTLLSNTPRSIVFTFADEFGNPIPRADVSITSDVAGALINPAGGRTLGDGTFTTTFRPPSVGTATFTAVVNTRTIAIPASLEIGNACHGPALALPATFSGTLVRDQGCVVSGSPVQMFTFTTPGGGLSVDIDPFPFFLAAIELRDDPAVPNLLLFADTTVNRQWLLPAGTFEFRVGAVQGQGPFTVNARLAPANRGDTIRLLAAAGTYTGQTLAPGDFVNSIDAFTDAFGILNVRPCTITVRSTEFDPVLSLTNSFGIAVGFDNNSGGGTDAQITRTSCTSSGGFIRLDISSADPGQTGAYTLIVTYN